MRDLGEFGLISRLQARIEARQGGLARLELGIGDDAAVWLPTPGARQVITTDALVQGIHFEHATTGWRDLGWKALAVNVSDLAAMGATPRHALVTLAVPGEAPVDDLLALYDGMLDLCEQFELQLGGGDVVAGPILMLSVTAVGEVRGEPLRRDAGRPADLVAVTGDLGASAGGLRLLQAGRRPPDGPERLFQAHLRPLPRVAEGLALAAAGVRCGMDLSDGLLGDLGHICERSDLGAEIEVERLPLDPALRDEIGDEALALAIGGGEDYELLCTAPAAVMARARSALARLGTPLTSVGRLVPGRGVRLLDARGREVSPGQPSWDHFHG